MVMGRHLRLQSVWLEQPLGGNIPQTSHHLGDQPNPCEQLSSSSSSSAGAFFHNMVMCNETLQIIIMKSNNRKTPSSTVMKTWSSRLRTKVVLKSWQIFSKRQDCNYSQILRPPISPVNHLLPSANRTVWWQLAFYIEDGEVWGVISSVALGTL